MTGTIRISDELYNAAKIHGKAEHRSIPKQIEYWAKIGRIAKENPDLPIDFIEGALIGLEELKNGEATPFSFDELK